jgi:hypothetical protein
MKEYESSLDAALWKTVNLHDIGAGRKLTAA